MPMDTNNLLHNQPRGSIPRLVLVTAVSVAFFHLPSVAQTTSVALDEIIVTAQKRQQTTQDIPATVTAFNSDFLDLTATKNFNDLSQITPGISIAGNADGFGKQIRIRGVGTNSYTPSIRPSVGIFIDEIPLVEPASAYNNMADIERIEILKGPQATLFGKEVSSGAISLFTKRPHTDGTEAYIEANIGSHGILEGRTGGNLPLTDTIAIRGSLYHKEADSLISGSGADGIEADGLRLRTLFTATPDLNIILGYEFHDTEMVGAESVAVEYGSLIETYAGIYNAPGGIGNYFGDSINTTPVDPYDYQYNDLGANLGRSTETEVASVNIEWALNDEWVFTAITSYQQWDQAVDKGFVREGDAADKLGLSPIIPSSSDASRSPFTLSPFTSSSSLDAKTQEFRLTFEGEELASIIGAFYGDTKDNNITPIGFAVGVIPFPVDIEGTSTLIPVVLRNATLVESFTDIKEWAVFTHNTYSFNSALDLTVGLRYSEVEKTNRSGQQLGIGDYQSLSGSGGLNPGLDSLFPISNWDLPTQKNTWEAVTGTLKLNYYLNENVSIFAGFDRGFKAGGFNTVRHDLFDPTGQSTITPDDFDSEFSDNFEIGFKGYFFNRTLRWNTAVFHQEYDDYQVEIQEEGTVSTVLQNAAKVVTEGAETELNWQANNHLMLDANIAYVDARWDDYDTAGCTRPQYEAVACDPMTGYQDLSDKRVNFTSPWTANINTTWADNLDNGMDWFVRGEIAFRDDIIFSPDLDPATKEGSYTLFNASLGLIAADKDWDILLWGKNLTNREYLVNNQANRDNPSSGGNAGLRAIPGMERSYGATLKYTF